MPEDNTSPNGQAPNGDDPQAQAANSTPQAGSEHPNASTANDDLMRQIRELRIENANYRTKTKEREQAAKDELDRQLAEQGKYKELADTHAQRVKELEPLEAQLSELSELINERIKADIKNWPDEVKSLVPGKDVSIKSRYEQVGKLQALADRLSQQAQGQQPGNRPNPKPAQNMTPDEVSQKALEELRSRSPGKYQL